MRRAIKAGIFGAALVASLFAVNQVVNSPRPSEPAPIVRTTERPSESPRPTTRTEAPSQTAQVTYNPTPTPVTTPSSTPSPAATPSPTPYQFYLSSPCSIECSMENFTTPRGSKWVTVKQIEKTQILYSGENGYFAQISPTTGGYDSLIIFDRSGYVIEYTIPQGYSLLRTGPTKINRGQPIANTGNVINAINANYAIALKQFSAQSDNDFISFQELQRAGNTKYTDLFKEDFK